MSKHPPLFEWQVLSSEADWQPASSPTERGHIRRRRWEAAIVLVLLVVAGSWLWLTTQTRVTRAKSELQSAAQGEVTVGGPSRPSTSALAAEEPVGALWQRQFEAEQTDLRAASPATDPKTVPIVEVQSMNVSGDQSVAQVRIHTGISTYRQTRFYQRTVEGWKRAAPVAELWGAPHSLETTHFVFHYRQNDAQAVTTVAAQLDALYASLSGDLDLPVANASDKLTIDVSMTSIPGILPHYLSTDRSVVTPSPALYLAPVEMTDTELLSQALVLILLEQFQDRQLQQHAVKAGWKPLLQSLLLWQLWQLDQPLTAWHHELTKWVYAEGGPATPQEWYPKLCALQHLWMETPAQLKIPLSCGTGERAQIHKSYSALLQSHPLSHLDQLAIPANDTTETGRISKTEYQDDRKVIALVTVLEYTVATYDRQRLPILVAALAQYENWETLIPAVYGVSAAEFETGWQAFVALHYR